MKFAILALSLLSSFAMASQPAQVTRGADGKTTTVFDAGKDGVRAFDNIMLGSDFKDAPVSFDQGGVKTFTLKDVVCTTDEANMGHCQGRDVNNKDEMVFPHVDPHTNAKPWIKVLSSVVAPFIDQPEPAMFGGTYRHQVWGASLMKFDKLANGHVIITLVDGFDRNAYAEKK